MKGESITLTGATEAARTLKALGVRRVFALCADQTNSLFDALMTEGISVVGCRQESAAVHMADGWARATGETGVAIVGGGPGFVNSVTGFAVAQSAATPVVVIAGQPALHTRERNGHQILYQADIVRTLTKWSQEVMSADTLVEFVSRGFGIAAAGKPGPVNISVPTKVFDGEVTNGAGYRIAGRDYRVISNAPSEEAVHEELSKLLNEAERPVLVIGGGAWWELESVTLLSVVEKARIPAFTTELARGLIADDGKCCFGYAHPSFNRTFREIRSADLLILVGTELNLHTAAPQKNLIAPDAKIVQLHRDPQQIGIARASDLSIIGPLESALQALSSCGNQAAGRHLPWLDHIRKTYAKHRTEWKTLKSALSAEASRVHPLLVCESMERHYSDRIRVVIDGGDFVHWPRLYFQAKSPGYWMDGAEIGVLGASVPVGIGAQLGRPAEQTWIFVGDGGFGFYGLEVSTAVEQKANVKIIVGNDSAWGVERRLQLKTHRRAVAADLPNIRYDDLARVLGAKGIFVEDPAHLDEAVDEFVATEGPCVLNVAIPRDIGRPLMN